MNTSRTQRSEKPGYNIEYITEQYRVAGLKYKAALKFDFHFLYNGEEVFVEADGVHHVRSRFGIRRIDTLQP